MSGITLLGKVVGLTLLILLCRLQKAEAEAPLLAKREAQSSCIRALQISGNIPLGQVRPDDFPEHFKLTLNVSCNNKSGHPLCKEWQPKVQENTNTENSAGLCVTAFSQCLLQTPGAVSYTVRSELLAENMDSEQKRDCITITGSLQHIPNAVTVSKTRPWSKIIDDCLSNDSVSVEPGPPSPGPVPPSTDPVPIIPVALPAAALVVVLAVATAGLVVVRKVVVRRRNLHGNLDSDSTESTPLLTSRVDFHSSTAAADPQPILAINHEAPPIQSTTPVPKPITYTADEQSITSDFGTSHGSTRSQSSTTLRGGSSSDSDKPQQDDRKDIVPPSVNPYRKRKPPVHNSNRTPIQDLSYHQPTSPPMQPNGPTNSSDYLVPKSSDSSDSLDARRPASQSPTPSSSSGSSNGSGYEGDDEMST